MAPFYQSIKLITESSKESASNLWQILKPWNQGNRIQWQLLFFSSLPQEFISGFWRKELLEIIESIDKPCYVPFQSLEKFRTVDADIIYHILKSVVNTIEKAGLQITLSYLFFEKFTADLMWDFNLLTKAYLQQEKITNSFDHDRNGLKALVAIDYKFLFKYIETFYGDKDWLNRNTNNQLSFVWDLENCNIIVEEALNLIIAKNPYLGLSKHPANILFNSLNEQQKEVATHFLINYLSKYSSSRNKVNAVFDIVRNQFKNQFEFLFKHFLSLNTDVKFFERISWTGNGGVYSGKAIIGELRSDNWQEILRIVNQCDNQLSLLAIKNFIKRQIQCYLNSAKAEHLRHFTDPDW